jgi:hypothetical protein
MIQPFLKWVEPWCIEIWEGSLHQTGPCGPQVEVLIGLRTVHETAAGDGLWLIDPTWAEMAKSQVKKGRQSLSY